MNFLNEKETVEKLLVSAHNNANLNKSRKIRHMKTYLGMSWPSDIKGIVMYKLNRNRKTTKTTKPTIQPLTQHQTKQAKKSPQI